MDKKRYRKVLLFFALFSLVIAIAGQTIRPDDSEVPKRIYYNVSAGNVVFTHSDHMTAYKSECIKHLSIPETQCADCHHELLKANDVKSCSDCHGDIGYTKDLMTHSELLEMHPKSCSMCHQSKKDKSASSCRTCHLKTGEPKLISCEECHPGSGYSLEIMGHDDLEMIEGHECSGCHSARRITDAIHNQCYGCHNNLKCFSYLEKEDMPESSSFACNVCHLKTH